MKAPPPRVASAHDPYVGAIPPKKADILTSPAPKTPRLYKGRIIDISDVLGDTRLLKIELENKQKLVFEAGQYAQLAMGDLPAQSFSIASPPHASFLEFHIRNSGRGISAYALDRLKLGEPVTLEAPFGHSHWRAATVPLLAIAGGLGIAPMKSILETHFQQSDPPPAHLYWGVRDESQLYLDRFFQDMAKRYPLFTYIPVLSEAKTETTRRTGFLATAVSEDFESLDALHIYMAGPPPMIDATRTILLEKGAAEDCLFCDAWTP